MNKTQTADIQKIARRFLKLGVANKAIFQRGNPAAGTRVKIESIDGELSIAYEFTERECDILKTISEVSGVPIKWLVQDAVGWLRSYVQDLPIYGTGQVFDLLDLDGEVGNDEGAAANVIPARCRTRTRAFLSALMKAWKMQGPLRSRPRHVE